MVVIGLGTAGANIARRFEKWEQYNVILPSIEVCETDEEQENNTPEILENINGEVWFIVCGASKVASSSLQILKQVKHCKVKILYIYPETVFLSSISKKRNRMVYGVLQEYCRSGLIDSIYLISNKDVEDIVGTGSISEYYSKINDAIFSIVHYYNIYQKSSPVFGEAHEPNDISRIRTFGIFDMEKNVEKTFFPLDSTTETCYNYNITEDELENNNTILKEIKNRVQQKVVDGVCSSFTIHSTDFEQNFCHMVLYTHYVQEEKK